MKQLLIKLALVVMSMSLVACSTNSQRENTTIGGVSGAVIGGLAGSAIGAGTGQIIAIGAGAIVGALVGSEVGKSMDSTDNAKVYKTMNSNSTNHAGYWTNTKTGVTYKVVPTSKRMSYHGYSNCRTYRSMTMMNGQKQVSHGTACRLQDGSWQVMN